MGYWLSPCVNKKYASLLVAAALLAKYIVLLRVACSKILETESFISSNFFGIPDSSAEHSASFAKEF